jgi:V8-like Glu-specific endopeptidase
MERDDLWFARGLRALLQGSVARHPLIIAALALTAALAPVAGPGAAVAGQAEEGYALGDAGGSAGAVKKSKSKSAQGLPQRALKADVAMAQSVEAGAAAAVAPLALPQVQSLRSPRLRSLDLAAMAGEAPMPKIVQGKRGPKKQRSAPAAAAAGDDVMEGEGVTGPGATGSTPQAQAGAVTPHDFGAGNIDTVFHYTDSQVDTELMDDAPYRATGWLLFTKANGYTYRCTASLISASIGVTAGHCVHDGSNGDAGSIRSATFTPAYSGSCCRYGSATVTKVFTTAGWYNEGGLDAGYDVALFTLNKRTRTTKEIGAYTGWYGFCYSDCLASAWQLTQLGYPGKYYDGKYMTEGQHLEFSDDADFTYGSGMEGGSSGGPHVANLGFLSGSAGSEGQSPQRNIVFAATSWGYIDRTIKIQGASSLSGPGDSNNFKAMFNAACAEARRLHGSQSCTPLP